MQFVDRALARRFEAAEEVPQIRYAEFYRKFRPDIRAEVKEIYGGHMIFAGVGSPIGRATGVGFECAICSADMERIEEFYRAHGAPAQIDVCPLTDSSLMELIKSRGYSIAELNNVLYLELKEIAEPAPGAHRIRPGDNEEAGTLSSVVERSFYPNGDAPETLKGDILAPLFQMDGSVSFVAEIENEVVACGAGLAIREHGIFALFGAGTLPKYQRRGLQTALLTARLVAAKKAGCEFAVIVTQGGTMSQRNAERLGFRVAYSKVTVMKCLDA
jgi:GNAT superfamily N-acetyltransferase